MRQSRLIVVVSGSLTISRVVHLKKMLRILASFFTDAIIIHEGPHGVLSDFGMKVYATGLPYAEANSLFPSRMLNYLMHELKKIKLILRQTRARDIVLFSGIYQPLSLLAVEIRGGYPVHFCGGLDVLRSSSKNRLLDEAYLNTRWAIQLALLRLSRWLVFETPSVRSNFNMGRFDGKSSCSGALFVDGKFSPVTPLRLREFDIGYVGALSEEKGVIEFLKLLPLVVVKRKIRVLMIGDGYLKAHIHRYIRENQLQNSVRIVHHVEYKDMPNQLNNIRLLVAPSQSEGLPNVVVEAMACGTPVLATKVGGIPDVIEDGKTGFLLTKLEPNYMAGQVIQLLDNPELLIAVGKRAQKEAMERFSLASARRNWKGILKDASDG